MSLDVVRQVRAQYPTPITEEQSVKICNEVAWRLNGNAAAGPWGLRDKPGGTQWGGYALDVVVRRPDGLLVDILYSTTNPAGPQWMELDERHPEWWAPVRTDWLDASPGPGPDPTPGDLTARVAALEARVGRLEFRTNAAGEALTGA